LIRAGDKQFEAAFHVATWQEHPPPTGSTHQTNVGAEPHDGPLEAAAWMRLLEPYDVSKRKRDEL